MGRVDDEHATAPARRPPGRPRSARSHEAVLDAAATLLDEQGLPGFSVDEVARRSGVSKATIYKHWRSGLEIAVEAYGARITEVMPVPAGSDVVDDLVAQVHQVAAVYAGPRGQVIAQLLGAGAGVPGGATLLRERFFADRMRETAAAIERGMAEGVLRDDVEPQLVLELLFGPIVFRLINGGGPLSEDDAAQLARLALRGAAA